jgi:hypothetical protein
MEKKNSCGMLSCEETGEIIYSSIYLYDFQEFNSANN